MPNHVSDADLFAALDELAGAGVLEWRKEDGACLSTKQVLQPTADELLAMSHLAARVWLTLCRMQRDLEISRLLKDMLARAERN